MFLRSSRLTGFAALFIVSAASVALADSLKPNVEVVKTHHRQVGGAETSSVRAYQVAMSTMHKNMRAPLSGNPDIDFVRQMIPHHQGALDMAKIQLKYGHDDSLKKFNEWVIFAQEQEIAFMKTWLDRHDNGAELSGAKDYYSDAMMTMHQNMMIHYFGDADFDYVRGMIAHHQGAVDMASIWMTSGSDPQLKHLASNIYSSQTQEIAWMQNWLAARAY